MNIILLFYNSLYAQTNDELFDRIISASVSGSETEVLAIKSKIEALAKPESGDNKNARSLNDKAISEFKIGNFDSALSLMNLAFEQDKSDAEISCNLGYFLLRAGKTSQAETQIRNSISLNPNRAMTWINLGEYFAKN
ncbi:MAG: hypothetical protein ABSB19_03670 [Methylomonas sp.]